MKTKGEEKGEMGGVAAKSSEDSTQMDQ